MIGNYLESLERRMGTWFGELGGGIVGFIKFRQAV
jgi:hypothetical protein